MTIRVGMAATLAVLSTLAGCAAYRAENTAIEQYPSIKQQIESFYNDRAVEEDWSCNEVDMTNIDKSKVTSQTRSQVKVAVTYTFASEDLTSGQGGDRCEGFSTRYFTFDRGAGGQLSLASMTGAQRTGP